MTHVERFICSNDAYLFVHYSSYNRKKGGQGSKPTYQDYVEIPLFCKAFLNQRDDFPVSNKTTVNIYHYFSNGHDVVWTNPKSRQINKLLPNDPIETIERDPGVMDYNMVELPPTA